MYPLLCRQWWYEWLNLGAKAIVMFFRPSGKTSLFYKMTGNMPFPRSLGVFLLHLVLKHQCSWISASDTWTQSKFHLNLSLWWPLKLIFMDLKDVLPFHAIFNAIPYLHYFPRFSHAFCNPLPPWYFRGFSARGFRRIVNQGSH